MPSHLPVQQRTLQKEVKVVFPKSLSGDLSQDPLCQGCRVAQYEHLVQENWPSAGKKPCYTSLCVMLFLTLDKVSWPMTRVGLAKGLWEAIATTLLLVRWDLSCLPQASAPFVHFLLVTVLHCLVLCPLIDCHGMWLCSLYLWEGLKSKEGSSENCQAPDEAMGSENWCLYNNDGKEWINTRESTSLSMKHVSCEIPSRKKMC